MPDITNKRVLIMGLGRFGGGVGAARFCVESDARSVRVTDLADEAALADSLQQLADLPIDYRLGEHREADFENADVVIVNPAVNRKLNRYIHAAERAGATLTTEIELLIERLPNREHVIGVTGSAGKSTVTAMIGHILGEARGEETVHVGGNIGGSLLGRIGRIAPDHWVVLELSSFMLEAIDHARWSPHIAVITNIGENHLDHHGDMDTYVRAKKTLLRHQLASDIAVLGEAVAEWRFDTPATGVIVDKPLETPLSVPGRHNALNAAMAVAAAEQAHVHRNEAIEAVAGFAGLPHRLQLVAEQGGRRFYNDSKSTTPEAAMLGIDAFDRRQAHVILGGYDKKSDLRPLACHAAAHAAAVYTIGATAEAIANAAEAIQDRCLVHRCDTLEDAMREATRRARLGQVVLLSPGCASWDQFASYEQRGAAFAELVLRYTTETGAAWGDPPAPREGDAGDG